MTLGPAQADDTNKSSAQVGEVRAYLRRLLLAIAIGIACMVATVVWAYQTYGTRLESAPPLPEGSPPLSHVPQPGATTAVPTTP